jgi:hypothetical protein
MAQLVLGTKQAGGSHAALMQSVLEEIVSGGKDLNPKP